MGCSSMNIGAFLKRKLHYKELKVVNSYKFFLTERKES